MRQDDLSDVVIIGGGISGVISLYWARKRGLKACLLEKASQVGGIWSTLPAWQDLQMQAGDWTLGGLPIGGVKQKDIQKNIQAWVSQYRLADAIVTDCSVVGTRWNGSAWDISTSKGIFHGRNLIVATGLHNEPRVPNLAQQNATVKQIHSSELRDPGILAGKRIAILGGGASAFDAIDLGFAHGASEIHWVYRSLTWMIPSTKPKDHRPALRILARNQMLVRDPRTVSIELEKLIRERYRFYGMAEILPSGELDMETTTAISGRPLLTTRFKEIHRHLGTVDRIVGNELFVGAESFPADILVYATGYKLNLRFLNLPEYSKLNTGEELSKRCGTYVRALDYPNLFFMGPTLLDINGSTPLLISMFSRTIIAHIMGRCEIPKTVYQKKPVHWGTLSVLAAFDRSNFWPGLWRLRYMFKAWYYARYPNRPIHFP